MRRALWETVVDLVGAAGPDDRTSALLRVTSLDVAVPIEVVLHPTGDGPELLGDLPRWRWRGGLDEEPGRLTLHCREVSRDDRP
jgi:hypothetical protein